MAFTVTSLGTGYNSGNTSVSITSLTWAAGDWLVVVHSHRGDNPLGCSLWSGSGSYYQFENTIISVNNSGNVTTCVYLFKAQMAASGSGQISASQTANDDCNIAVYKLTGEEVAIASTSSIPQVTNDGYYTTLSTTTTICGNKYFLPTGTVSSLSFEIYAVGTTTGTLYGRVYNADTGSLVGTLGSVDASSIGTTPTETITFNSSGVDISTAGNYYLSIEFSRTAGSIQVARKNTRNPVTEVGVGASYYGSQWNEVQGSVYDLVVSGINYCEFVTANTSATVFGNGNSVTAGPTSSIAYANSVGLGVVGFEEQTDEKGTWTTGSAYIEGNYQDTGATSDGSNSNSLFTTMEVLSGSTAQYSEMTSTGLNQYTGIVVVLGVATVIVEEALTGSSVTTSGGTLTTEVLIHRALTGSAVTTAGGDLQSDVSIALTGSEVASAAGLVRKARKKALTGEEVTSAEGTLNLAVDLSLAGAEVSVASGTLREKKSRSLIGEELSTSGGTLTPVVASADVLRNLTGSQVTTNSGAITTKYLDYLVGSEVASAEGSLSYNIKSYLVGDETTTSGGNLKPDVTIALSGSESSVSAGILIGLLAKRRNLTGSQVTSAAGSLGLEVKLPLSGDEVAINSGTIAWSKAKRKALSGSQSLINSGTLGLKVALPLNGSEVSTESGILLPVQNIQKALTGSSCSTESGTLGTKSGRVLSGLEVLTNSGSITPSIKISLNGVTVTSAAGTVSAISNRISLVGSEVVTSAGNLIGYRIPEVSLIGFIDSNVTIEGEIGYNLESSGTFFNVIELENDIFV